MRLATQHEVGLRDSFGRVAQDLRISLTDRCNLRCTYCMPADGLAWLPGATILSDEEIVRLAGVAIRLLGVHTVRFTGGEPLLRPGLADIIAAVRAIPTVQGGPPQIALTSNGIGLDAKVASLAAAGLTRVNISLDSLDRDRYASLARRDRLPDVLRGLEAADAAGLHPVKVNTVAMRGVNEVDILPLARFCLERGYQLRFIEQMPLGPRHGWDREAMVPAAEVLALLQSSYRLRPAQGRGAAPSEDWEVVGDDGSVLGRIGVIASVTRPFCAACDRTRLTADGQVRTCLFSRTETDLRTPLRAGADDAELAALWQGAHRGKGPGHGIDQPGFEPPQRTMSSIGG